jgi:hypothetical protein
MMKNTEENIKLYLDYNKEYEEMMSEIKDHNEWYPVTFQGVFFLAIGYAIKKSLKPLPLNPKSKNQENKIRISVVINDKDNTYLKAVAFWHSKDIETIKNLNTVYEIAEEYANAGLKDIKENFFNITENPTFKLAEITLE